MSKAALSPLHESLAALSEEALPDFDVAFTIIVKRESGWFQARTIAVSADGVVPPESDIMRILATYQAFNDQEAMKGN